MKKQNNSLTIQKNMAQAQIPAPKRLSAVFPGCLLLAGFWGMLLQALQLSGEGFCLLIPAVIALVIGLVFRWDKKWQVWTAIGILAAACIGCVLLRKALASGLAGVMERLGVWWFLQTGSFTPGFADAGDIRSVLCLGAVISGLVTALLLRMKNPWAQALLALAVLTCRMAGLHTDDWWLALYLLGTLLTVAACASGQGKPLALSGGIALVLAAAIGIGCLQTGSSLETALGKALQKQLHSLCWEESDNPLPEGRLEDLGAYRPADAPVLKVTMENWTPLYLRGFVAGCYTDSGWEALKTEAVAPNAEALYALQSGYFLSATQICAAAQTVGVIPENGVTVENIGACRAYAYLPYGAGDVAGDVLNPEDLLWEGSRKPTDRLYSARLYGITDSYLLQADLKDLTDTAYRRAEGIYREQVYENYVTIPGEVRDVLADYIAIDGEITTVKAKREIVSLLQEMIAYEENVLTSTGEKDFLSYTLEVSRSGYSVHYATLATLMLRYLGIPARYVEGFVVTPSQAEALGSGEALTLTDANAHAWAEYYLDGVGWLPFDATPGYSEILQFELPGDGLPTENNGGSVQQDQQELPEQPPKKPQVQEEQIKDSQRLYIREAVNILLFILLLALLALILRTAVLRSRLRKRQNRLFAAGGRKACAGVLCCIRELAESMDEKNRSHSVPELARHISEALDGRVEAAELEWLFNEVWYSAHPISPAQTHRAEQWLALTKAAWNQKVSRRKRFKQRFITCKIL